MLKTTILNGKFIEEKEINFNDFSVLVREYFLLMDNDIKSVNVRIEFPNTTGIAATFNNHIEINGLYDCIKEFNNNLILEFKEFTQSMAINENANVTLDFMNNRMFINDYHIAIYFNK